MLGETPSLASNRSYFALLASARLDAASRKTPEEYVIVSSRNNAKKSFPRS